MVETEFKYVDKMAEKSARIGLNAEVLSFLEIAYQLKRLADLKTQEKNKC